MLKSYWTAEEIVPDKVKKQTKEWRKLFSSYLSNRELIKKKENTEDIYVDLENIKSMTLWYGPLAPALRMVRQDNTS